MDSSTRLGRWILGTKLAVGGTAVVHLALCPEGGQVAALKAPYRQHAQDPARRARFAAEVRRQQALSPPSFAAVLDADLDAEVPYVALEYLPGQDLAALARAGPAPSLSLLEATANLAAGLAALHGRGWVHGDLKPANAWRNPLGRTVLLDLGSVGPAPGPTGGAGASAPEGPTAPSPRVAAWTLGYAAPELLEGGPATIASDLYGLGLTAFELATGTRALAGRSLPEVLAQQRAHGPFDPLEFAPGVPRDLAQRVVDWTALDPGQRDPEGAGTATLARRLEGQRAALVAQDPERLAVPDLRGRLAARLALGQLAEARAALDDLLGADPDHPQTAALAAQVAAGLGDLDGAHAWALEALGRGASAPLVLPLMVRAALGAGHPWPEAPGEHPRWQKALARWRFAVG